MDFVDGINYLIDYSRMDFVDFFVQFTVLFFVLLFLDVVRAQNLEKSRSVWVEQGLVKGKIFKIDARQVQIFRGIP